MNQKVNLNIFLVIVAVIGISLSSFSGWLLYKLEEKAIVSELQKDIDERAASIYRELLINFEGLRSLAILFGDERYPEYDQFRKESQKIIARHNDIQALEWIPKVIRSERMQHELNIRRYFPNYEISERQEQGLMVRAGGRPEYYPVYFLEPFIGNETALGFDLASSAARLETLKKSRDKGAPQATASITLVQEQSSGDRKGFLAFLPVYKGSPSTVMKRRESLIGFVLGVYRIGDIFSSSALSDKSLDIEMKLVDESISSAAEILYIQRAQSNFSLQDEIVYRKELPEIWGRKWALIASPTKGYIDIRRDMLPQVMFGFGFLFTVLVVLYIKMSAQRTATIKRVVIEKTDELSEANKKLELLSRSDGLTGIANRRFLDEFLDKEWSRAIRRKSYLSFIIIDIDYFKLYNDNYGHLTGDRCLKEVAETLRGIPRRATDLIARYGGEEFALVLAETENAESVANNCRRAIEELQIEHKFSETDDVLTISVGLCTYAPKLGTDPNLVIDAADKALYKAKEEGRNRVVIYAEGF